MQTQVCFYIHVHFIQIQRLVNIGERSSKRTNGCNETGRQRGRKGPPIAVTLKSGFRVPFSLYALRRFRRALSQLPIGRPFPPPHQAATYKDRLPARPLRWQATLRVAVRRFESAVGVTGGGVSFELLRTVISLFNSINTAILYCGILARTVLFLLVCYH